MTNKALITLLRQLETKKISCLDRKTSVDLIIFTLDLKDKVQLIRDSLRTLSHHISEDIEDIIKDKN